MTSNSRNLAAIGSAAIVKRVAQCEYINSGFANSADVRHPDSITVAYQFRVSLPASVKMADAFAVNSFTPSA